MVDHSAETILGIYEEKTQQSWLLKPIHVPLFPTPVISFPLMVIIILSIEIYQGWDNSKTDDIQAQVD